jgi:hypothetical protein
MPYVAVNLADSGEEIFVNPAQVVKIIQDKVESATDQPPEHTTTLIFAGGAKKEVVAGRAYAIAQKLGAR